jgi:hypothetical protein
MEASNRVDQVTFEYEGHTISASVPPNSGSSTGNAEPRELIWGVKVGSTTHLGPRYTFHRDAPSAEAEVKSWLRQHWDRVRPR